MKIALGADHGGFELKEKIKLHLSKKEGIEVIDFGTNSTESVDYPKYGHLVANGKHKYLLESSAEYRKLWDATLFSKDWKINRKEGEMNV